MTSHILTTATRFLLPLLLLFSLFLLHRGHHEPGGGFVGGLVAAAAFSLYTIAFTVREARQVLRVSPRLLIVIGLSCAAGSGLVAVALGRPFMTGVWLPFEVPALGKLGTPLLFDIGVYLVVVGVVLMIVFALAED